MQLRSIVFALCVASSSAFQPTGLAARPLTRFNAEEKKGEAMDLDLEVGLRGNFNIKPFTYIYICTNNSP
jgi:hypothetical protein